MRIINKLIIIAIIILFQTNLSAQINTALIETSLESRLSDVLKADASESVIKTEFKKTVQEWGEGGAILFVKTLISFRRLESIETIWNDFNLNVLDWYGENVAFWIVREIDVLRMYYVNDQDFWIQFLIRLQKKGVDIQLRNREGLSIYDIIRQKSKDYSQDNENLIQKMNAMGLVMKDPLELIYLDMLALYEKNPFQKKDVDAHFEYARQNGFRSHYPLAVKLNGIFAMKDYFLPVLEHDDYLNVYTREYLNAACLKALKTGDVKLYKAWKNYIFFEYYSPSFSNYQDGKYDKSIELELNKIKNKNNLLYKQLTENSEEYSEAMDGINVIGKIIYGKENEIDVESLKSAIKKVKNIHIVELKRNLIYSVTKYNDAEVLQFFLDIGMAMGEVWAGAMSYGEISLLDQYAAWGNSSLAKVLLDHKTKLGYSLVGYWPEAMESAVKSGDKATVDLFLKKGLGTIAPDSYFNRVEYSVDDNHKYDFPIRIYYMGGGCSDYGASVNYGGYSLSHRAVESGYFSLVRRLIDFGDDPLTIYYIMNIKETTRINGDFSQGITGVFRLEYVPVFSGNVFDNLVKKGQKKLAEELAVYISGSRLPNALVNLLRVSLENNDFVTLKSALSKFNFGTRKYCPRDRDLLRNAYYWLGNSLFRDAQYSEAIKHYSSGLFYAISNTKKLNTLNELKKENLKNWANEGESNASAAMLAYNLACSYSHLSDFQLSLDWLRIAVALDSKCLTYALGDKDLDALKLSKPDWLTQVK